MEPNFQTSFIPKKPMMEEKTSSSPRSISFLTLVAIFIFFTVLLASGGLYFYKILVQRNIAKMESQLELAKASFEPQKIVQMQVLDKRLIAANEILAHHIDITPIFTILQGITLKTVQYTSFSYDLGSVETDGKISIKMKGIAVGYRSIALQSDLFAKNSALIDPVFSDLTLDNAGNVLFSLDFTVDPSLVNYKQTLSQGTVNITPVLPGGN